MRHRSWSRFIGVAPTSAKSMVPPAWGAFSLRHSGSPPLLTGPRPSNSAPFGGHAEDTTILLYNIHFMQGSSRKIILHEDFFASQGHLWRFAPAYRCSFLQDSSLCRPWPLPASITSGSPS